MALSRAVALRPDSGQEALVPARAPWLDLVRRVGDAALEQTRAHPLRPAAVRVERSRVDQGGGGRADQTALTVWFGAGPNLPGPALPAATMRLAGRAVAAAVGAAALGAMAVIASRREAERRPVRRLN